MSEPVEAPGTLAVLTNLFGVARRQRQTSHLIKPFAGLETMRPTHADFSEVCIETFMVTSWLEHLRQHRRVTNADRVVQNAVREFGSASEPKVSHFIAVSFVSSNEPQ
jgi:hypothetical protein